jgi:hypothetical protein
MLFLMGSWNEAAQMKQKTESGNRERFYEAGTIFPAPANC